MRIFYNTEKIELFSSNIKFDKLTFREFLPLRVQANVPRH